MNPARSDNTLDRIPTGDPVVIVGDVASVVWRACCCHGHEYATLTLTTTSGPMPVVVPPPVYAEEHHRWLGHLAIGDRAEICGHVDRHPGQPPVLTATRADIA